MAEMKRGGCSSRRSTRRAPRLPCASSSCTRVRRTVTRPYSAATKKAFAATMTATANSSSAVVIEYSDRRRSSLASIVGGSYGLGKGEEPLKRETQLPIHCSRDHPPDRRKPDGPAREC